MSKSPAVSVILPAYNAEKCLEKCVESVLAQTFSDFELLLVNDGSSDGTAGLCDRFSEMDPRVRTLHKENGGCGSARNVALSEARGQWITFCDADDWVGEKWLECYMENINDADLVVQGFRCENWPFDGGPDIGLDDYVGRKEDFITELYAQAAMGYLWCKLFRADIIADIDLRYNESLRHRGDEEFLMRYLLAVNVVSNVKEGHYDYFYPDNIGKYLDLLHPDCFYSLFSSTKIIFGSSYSTTAMVRDYFDMSTILLLRKYKARDESREDVLRKYIDLYMEEIPVMKYRRVLFKPLYFILRKGNLPLSHRLISLYSSVLGLLGKV